MGIYLGSPLGGVETSVRHLASLLPQFGWEPAIVVNRVLAPDWIQYYRARGVRTRSVAVPDIDDPRCAPRLLRVLEELDLDAYLPNYQTFSLATIPHLAADGRAVVMTANASHREYLDEITPWALAAHRVVGVSRFVCAALERYVGIQRSRIHYVPNCGRMMATMPHDRGDPGPINLLYVGRLDEDKNVWRYLFLADALLRREVDFQLTLLGDGSGCFRIALALQQHPRLARRVKFAGPVEPDHVPRWLEDSDVFVLLSDTEGFSLSLVEAMGYGLVPVVGDIASGNPELVRSGWNGFLVQPDDTETAARRIEALAEHPEMRRRLSTRAYETVRSSGLTPIRMARRYAEILDEAVVEASKSGHLRQLVSVPGAAS